MRTDVNLGGALYEPPTLQVLGTVSELTEYCVWGKAIGKPDYVFHIAVPITNCSA